MALVDTIRRIWSGKDHPPIINDQHPNRPEITVRGGGMPGAIWSGAGYQMASLRGYQGNTDVYACISLIATAGKQVKWDELAVDAEGDPVKRKIDPERIGPSRALLRKVGGPSFIEAWLSYLLLSGNSYYEIVRRPSNRSDILTLYQLEPDQVEPVLNQQLPRRPISSWRYRTPAGTYQSIPLEDMNHSKLFSPVSTYLGMSPIQAAMTEIDVRNEGATLAKRILQRGFVPGWVEGDPEIKWTDNSRADLKRRIKESKQSGEELFLVGAKWHQMGFDMDSSGVNESRVLTKRDIASVFHVPPELIGDSESKTYSNYQEARQALYTEAVIPLLTQFRDSWNQTIGKALRSFLIFDKDSFDAMTIARSQNTDRVCKTFASGLITQNEGRADLFYDPVSNVQDRPGDTFYAPANFMPLVRPGEEELSEPQEGEDE